MDPENLLGVEIKGGWTISERRKPSVDGTGGCHSFGYLARDKRGNLGFVKVLDTKINRKVKDPLADLQLRIEVFQYECEIARKCLERNMNAIVRAIDYGTIDDGSSDNPLYYILFEMAKSDLREQVDLEGKFDAAFRTRVLHRVSVGVQQLHKAEIAHQDIKPSNVSVFAEDKTKLSDLGHAHWSSKLRPGTEYIIAADPTYAPPEQLYGYASKEWETRRFGADLYLLGSLIAYLFTGVGATTLLDEQLRSEHHWTKWRGTYADVLPYVRDAMETVLNTVIAETKKAGCDELDPLVRYLCEPDPSKRGHPQNRSGSGGRFGVERFVSRFDYCAKRCELQIAKRKGIE